MCDFCENVFENDEEAEKELRKYCDSYILFGDSDGFYIYINNAEYFNLVVLRNIKYCPMCGRKLSEETENTSLRDRIIEKIKKTDPDYINYSDFYKKYGTLILGIGDKWHWFENLTDEAKREGLLQITDMSDTELFDLYARINEDWERTRSNQFWEEYAKTCELENESKIMRKGIENGTE